MTNSTKSSRGMPYEGRRWLIGWHLFLHNLIKTNFTYLFFKRYVLWGMYVPHWWTIFLQVASLVSNFNMYYLFLYWSHLRQTSQKKIQEGCPMRDVHASLAYIHFFIIPFQTNSTETFSMWMSYEGRSCLICQQYFFKWTHWWPTSIWIIPSQIGLHTCVKLQIHIKSRMIPYEVHSGLIDQHLFSIAPYRKPEQKMFQ